MGNPFSILDIYKIVVSPSILGFNAKIISSIFSLSMRSNKVFNSISSGEIPSSGDIKPFKTWYCPL